MSQWDGMLPIYALKKEIIEMNQLQLDKTWWIDSQVFKNIMK